VPPLAAQDQTMSGNLADAVWQITERRPEALGDYRARVGDRDRATDHLARAMALDGNSPYVAYCGAVAMATRGDAAAASRPAGLAVANGYPQSLLGTDPLLGAAAID
jgi:hypothetical protein